MVNELLISRPAQISSQRGFLSVAGKPADQGAENGGVAETPPRAAKNSSDLAITELRSRREEASWIERRVASSRIAGLQCRSESASFEGDDPVLMDGGRCMLGSPRPSASGNRSAPQPNGAV